MKGIYYHATGGTGETGVGMGLYLGKDKRALDNFYNCDGQEGNIETFKGNPSFIDLTIYNEFEKFSGLAENKYGKEPSNNHLKELTISMGYDGIRYYDPIATGEEFVLYNFNKVKKIKSTNKKKLLHEL